jgi:hypothetical protein
MRACGRSADRAVLCQCWSAVVSNKVLVVASGGGLGLAPKVLGDRIYRRIHHNALQSSRGGGLHPTYATVPDQLLLERISHADRAGAFKRTTYHDC